MTAKSKQALCLLIWDDGSRGPRTASQLLACNPQSELTVTLVESLEQALHQARINPPDAILLGAATLRQDTAEQLRSVTAPHPPVLILITETLEDDGQQSARYARFDDHLCSDELSLRLLLRALRAAVMQNQNWLLRARLSRAEPLASAGQIAASMAHEINNPAAFILANTTALLTDIDAAREDVEQCRMDLENRGADVSDDELRTRLTAAATLLRESDDLLRDNLDGIKRIAATVRHIRALSHFDSADVQVVDLNEIVQVACRVAHNEIRHRALLSVELRPLPPITANRSALTQVVTNLLVNAAQAMDERPGPKATIRLSTSPCPRGLTLIVEDTGKGIAASALPFIFEPFFTTKADGEGTGLGLSLCRETIKLHNGDIRVSSRVGEGTRVEIFLPENTGLTEPHKAPLSQPPSTRRPRVLVIDDEPLLLRAYARIFGPHYDIVLAEGGAEALKRLTADANFDVVFCDLMMPEVDGRDIYDFVSATLPALAARMVFCSGGAFTQRAGALLAEVPNPCLTKPLDPEILQSLVAEVAATGRISSAPPGVMTRSQQIEGADLLPHTLV